VIPSLTTPTRDDTIEAHYASLERACGCYDGYHYLGRPIGLDGPEELALLRFVQRAKLLGLTLEEIRKPV
jgi:hypothetical protein